MSENFTDNRGIFKIALLCEIYLIFMERVIYSNATLLIMFISIYKSTNFAVSAFTDNNDMTVHLNKSPFSSSSCGH